MVAGRLDRRGGALRLGSAAALASALGWAQPARSQGHGLEAAAETAFEDGMQAMQKGDYERACPLIEESLKYDPGMAAKFRLAECYEKLGRLATAWEQYLQVSEEARAAGMKDRAEFARERAEAIAPKLASLVVEIPEEAVLDMDLEVRVDGQMLPRPFWGAPTPVDTGPHRVVVSAPGRGRWIRSARIMAEGSTRTIAFPGFDASEVEMTPAKDDSDDSGMAQTVAAVVVGGLGAGLLGAGLGVGLGAGSRYDDAESHCVGAACDEVGTAIRKGAIEQATVATVLFVVGASCVIGGGVLWLTTPHEDDSKDDLDVELVVGPTGLAARGWW